MRRIIVSFLFLMSAALASESSGLESGTLIIFTLTVESSYSQGIERPAAGRFDTVQWWIGSKVAWRIKTFAIDSDVHPYRIETTAPREELKQLAVENTKKHYGDVISKMYVVEIPAGASLESVRRQLREQKLRDVIEWVPAGYFFWQADDSGYVSKSRPVDR